MKDKTKKIGITFTILSVIVVIACIIFAILIHNEKQLQEDMATVKKAYTGFSGDIVDNYHIRTDIVSKLESFTEETYPEEHESYVELFKSYEAKIDEVKGNVDTLEEKCTRNFEDGQTKIFCTYYQSLYESVNNIYVIHVNKYNELIKQYNDNPENEIDYDIYPLGDKKTVDFDKNGIYEGQNQETQEQ